MTIAGITLPTRIRHLLTKEWHEVDHVFGPTLPARFRVFIADGIGVGASAFTVPTSAISAALNTAVYSNPFMLGGPLTSPLRALGGVSLGELTSVGNLGYVINVGPKYYPDTQSDDDGKQLLIHEMTHVWQGKNSVFALTATLQSLAAQCSGMLVTGSVSGRALAYSYTIGTPPPPWGSFNPEQQAMIVQHFYRGRLYGHTSLGPEWPYVRDYVRLGKVR